MARPTRRSYRCGLAGPPGKHSIATRSNYSNLPRSPPPAVMKRAGGGLAHWSDETFNVTDFNVWCSDLKSHPLSQLQWKVQQLTWVWKFLSLRSIPDPLHGGSLGGPQACRSAERPPCPHSSCRWGTAPSRCPAPPAVEGQPLLGAQRLLPQCPHRPRTQFHCTV